MFGAHAACRARRGTRAARAKTPTAMVAGALLLLACATLPRLTAAAATSDYTTEQQSNTLAFLQGFATPAWGLDTAWTGTDFCTWTYVTCDYSAVAVSLETVAPATTATLPELGPDVAGSLVLVSRISVHGMGDKLSGSLPASWSGISRLSELNLSGNALSGSLPPEWGALRYVSTLDLHSNQLTGPLPSEWRSMSYLYYLYLNNNQLSGSIPEALGDMYIKEIDISGNKFCGCAPSGWASSYITKLTADSALTASNCSSANACPVDDSSTPAQKATLRFLQSFTASMPALQTQWADTRYCAFAGVTCSGDTATLDLSSVALEGAGSLPELAADLDGSLVAVTGVRAVGRGALITGTLPASWGSLSQLTEVTLAGNALSGTLPAAWGSLSGLTTLNVSGNAVTGSLPVSWGSLSDVRTLDLSSNQLTGPLPSEWKSMSSLRYLYLNNNQLSGSIATTFGNMYVYEVHISGNNFCGCVPSGWASSYYMTFTADPALTAANCSSANACAVDDSSTPAQKATLRFLQSFTASMPALQAQWTDTRYCAFAGVTCSGDTATLDLSSVALEGAGSLPELAADLDGSLVAVTRVRAVGRGALITGTLPASWGSLSQLTSLSLDGNTLSGTLPVSWASLRALTGLNVSGNAVTGSLPVEWYGMRYMRTVDVSSNQLTGPLPIEWRSMSGLYYLYLNNNELSGSIATTFGNMFLYQVDISQNNFCGCAPRGWNSSYSISFTADPALRAANCSSANACPVDDSSTPAQKATLRFLQSFTASMPALQAQWADTRYCAFAGVTCSGDTATLDLSSVALEGAGSLPELAADLDGSLVAVTRVRAVGRGALITGTLPASWGSLSQLTEVTLAGNALSGTLPASWVSLSELTTLNVSGNALSGTLPPEWSAFYLLSVLGLRSNALTGTLPAAWSSFRRVATLDLGVNGLSGGLPAEWRSMSYLDSLYVNDNQLSGSIPAALGSLYVYTVDISGNNFCGCAPTRWNSTSSVTFTADPEVRAADCSSANACPVDDSSTPAQKATLRFLQSFTASMPALQAQWADTRYCAFAGVTCSGDTATLDLSSVALEGAGSLPELAADLDGSLVAVTRVRAVGRGALITGTLPASWGSLSQLTEVTLAGNAQSGTLPATWGSLSALSVLNASRNAFSGSLPPQWGSLRYTPTVDVSSNQLAGTLPPEWRSMSGLDYLYLNNNQLSGSIPNTLGELFMYEVDISQNNFCGCVPSGWASSFFLTLTADPALTAANCSTANVCEPTTTATSTTTTSTTAAPTSDPTTTSTTAAPTSDPTTTTTTAAPAKSRGRNLTALWAVIGAVGGCLVVAAVVLLVLWWRRRAAAAAAKKSEESRRAPDSANSEPYGKSDGSL